MIVKGAFDLVNDELVRIPSVDERIPGCHVCYFFKGEDGQVILVAGKEKAGPYRGKYNMPGGKHDKLSEFAKKMRFVFITNHTTGEKQG